MNQPKRYLTRAVEVEALRWTGHNLEAVNDFLGSWPLVDRAGRVSIATPAGRAKLDVGDYIVKGLEGEFYPCKPDIFDATYDAVNREAD